MEALAAETSDTVCLGVGLHSGYGAAQRMYVLRGYVPDGSGVWYEGCVWDQYAPCVNDDELNLFLSKKLFLCIVWQFTIRIDMIFINNEALHSFSLKDENAGLRLLHFRDLLCRNPLNRVFHEQTVH